MGGVLLWVALIAGLAVGLLLLQLIYLAVVFAWSDQNTSGLAYYGKPPEARRRFRETLKRHARLLYPMLRLLERFSSFTFDKASFTHRGIAGPKGTCSPDSFAKADQYQARPEDVFVVTQMKCGTTWMQHLVYQVLWRGEGDLVETGRTLYGVSPWLESLKSVPLEQSHTVGNERPSRIIKTHMPVSHCPWSNEAKYIYVARHPVSCFASCVDFIASNLGAMRPPLEAVEQWFTDPDQMWWGTWPDHVAGWWRQAREHDNVLFVYFEDMKEDLGDVADSVAAFLGLAPLSERERELVTAKCSFGYMRDHQEAFEMYPPHLLAIDAELFVRGSADRYRDVPEATRQWIRAWCASHPSLSDFPLADHYPDVASSV